MPDRAHVQDRPGM